MSLLLRAARPCLHLPTAPSPRPCFPRSTQTSQAVPHEDEGPPPHRSQRPPAPTVVDSTHRAVLRGTGKLRAPRPCPGCDGGIRQLLLPARAGVQETGDLGSARSSATEFLQICREITDFPGISPEVWQSASRFPKERHCSSTKLNYDCYNIVMPLIPTKNCKSLPFRSSIPHACQCWWTINSPKRIY